ncbi:MAG: hypothetical protein BWY72_02136 [Bacteroidetes bacterium ADurb.Bin416]|nr:MAG: hypothetical protein BWY72_02136 [Bacteroidetes bacterium ADurb.Bin416]
MVDPELVGVTTTGRAGAGAGLGVHLFVRGGLGVVLGVLLVLFTAVFLVSGFFRFVLHQPVSFFAAGVRAVLASALLLMIKLHATVATVMDDGGLSRGLGLSHLKSSGYGFLYDSKNILLSMYIIHSS